jgi:hypothetical protein
MSGYDLQPFPVPIKTLILRASPSITLRARKNTETHASVFLLRSPIFCLPRDCQTVRKLGFTRNVIVS